MSEEMTFLISVVVEPTPYVAINEMLYATDGVSAAINADYLRAGDADSPLDNFVFKLVSLPTSGLLRLNGTQLNVNGTFTQADVDNHRVTFEGGPQGTDSFTFTVSDESYNESSPQTFLITIVPVDSQPYLVINQTLSVSEGGSATIDQFVLLVEDADTDAEHIVFTIQSLPEHGNLYFNASPLSVGSTFSQAELLEGRLSYGHNGSETSGDSFTFTVADESAHAIGLTTFSVSVLSVNDVPIAEPDGPFSVSEDGTLVIPLADLTANDLDPENDVIYVVEALQPLHGTVYYDEETESFVYTPNANYNGPDEFDYVLSDGTDTTSGMVTINVTPVNDAPIAHADALATGTGTSLEFTQETLAANDVDMEGDDLSVAGLHGHPSHGSVTWHADGSFTYTPSAGYVGLDSFQYDVTDGQYESRATVWIEVGPLVVLQAGGTNLTLAEDGSVALKLSRDRIDGQAATHFRLSVLGGTLSRGGQPITSTTNVTSADCARRLHVHAGGRLQRPGHAHDHAGQRRGQLVRSELFRREDRDDYRHAGQRCAGRRCEFVFALRRRLALAGRPRRARQR
ncbi:MAG: cadherin-like domain-containing protein [Pirellulales bacterium]